jgi:hypothetical protein
LEFVRSSQFHCPQCGELCGVHETVEKRLRHLNFSSIRCELLAECHAFGADRTEFIWRRYPGLVPARATPDAWKVLVLSEMR